MASDRRSRITQLMAIESLVMLSGALAGVFSVVYLVASGLTFIESSLFYLQSFIIASVLCLIVGRTGFASPRKWMALGILTLSINNLCFVFLTGYHLLFTAPWFFGFYIVGFWVPFNTLMLRQTSVGNRGELIGLFFLVYPVIALISPIVGGFAISRIGYYMVFGSAFLALFANCFLILVSPATKVRPMRPRIRFRKLGRRLKMSLFFQGSYEGLWWTAGPLLALLFAREEFVLGMLFALFGLAGGIASVLVGRISDRRGNRARYVRFGALISIPLILGIAFSPDIIVFAALTCGVNLTIQLIPILLMALATDRMERTISTCSLTREYLLNTGRILGAALCVLILLCTNDVRLAYAASAFMVLGTAFVR